MKRTAKNGTSLKNIFVILIIILININLISTKTTQQTKINLFASPTGKGDCTTIETPCSFSHSIETAKASNKEEIKINLLPGDYNPNIVLLTSFHDLSITSTSSNNNDVKFSFQSASEISFTINSSHVTIEKITFIDYQNTIFNIEDDQSLLTVINCQFINNTKQNPNSGGLIIKSISPIVIISSFFSGNLMKNSPENYFDYSIDGILIKTQSTIEISDSTFTDNSIIGNYSYIHGGNIYSQSNITIENSTFKNQNFKGMARGVSGGVVFAYTSLFVKNSTFENIFIEMNGNDIYGDGSNIRGEEGIFSALGTVLMSEKPTNISSSSFTNNQITLKNYVGMGSGRGGAVYCSGNILSVDSSNFTKNVISIDASNATFSKPSFFASGEASGGAIDGTIFSILNSNFESNSITVSSSSDHYLEVYGWGGAINGNEISITNSSFLGNYVDNQVDESNLDPRSEFSGGAITSENIFISQSYFNNNRAYHSGGAVYLSGFFYPENSNIVSTSFIGNIADGEEMSRGGGAIFDYSPINSQDGSVAVLSITSCKFLNNRANYGDDILLINAISAILLSGNVDVYNYNNYYDGASPSATSSFIRSPSPSPKPFVSNNPFSYDSNQNYEESSSESSSSKSGEDDEGSDTWWIVLVSVFSGLFITILFVSFIVAIVAIIFIRRKKSSQYTAHSINDDAFDDDEII